MMYVIFAAAALITVLAAVKLSSYADVLSERTSLGGMLAGTLLLAGATSLPEVTTSATAVFVDNPDIAVGNVLGSNLFNLMILALFDVIYRKKQMMSQIHSSHLLTGFFGLALTAFVLFTIVAPTGIVFLGIGIESYLLVIFYIISMKVISRAGSQVENVAAATAEVIEAHHTRAISVRRAKIGFAVAAAVIFVSGSLLTITGDAIASATGVSSSFIGSFLIAGATSLPEVVSVIVAIQLLNYNLAVGTILGSNLFNLLILSLSDVLYRDGTILAAASPVSSVTALSVIGLNIIVLGSIIYWRKRTPHKGYALPSIMLIVLYGLSSYLIFTF